MQPGEVLWRSMVWKLDFLGENRKDGRQKNGGKDGKTDRPKWNVGRWNTCTHVLLDWPDENEYMCMWSISNVVPTTSCRRLIGLQSPLQAVHNERVQPGRSQLYSWPKVVSSQLHLFLAGGLNGNQFLRHKQNLQVSRADPLEFSRQIFEQTNGNLHGNPDRWDMWYPGTQRGAPVREAPGRNLRVCLTNFIPGKRLPTRAPKGKERKGFPIFQFSSCCQRWVFK